MKFISKIVLGLAAAGSCAVAVAQSDSADQERRMRNRDEAIANWERTQPHDGMAMTHHNDMQPHKTMRERTHDGAEKTRAFTHRQAEKVRRFGERQNAHHPAPRHPTTDHGEAPAAIGK